jgi:Ribbon-helix-helix protein, copG family
MRTTVEFDEDTARAIEQARRERGIGVSEAVNELIRRGLLPREDRPAFRQRTAQLGLRVDVSNVADALEALEGATAR